MVNSGSFDEGGSEGESVKAEFTQLEDTAAEASFTAVVPETAQIDIDINSIKPTKTSLQCSVPLDKVKNVLEICNNKSKLNNLFILENYLQKKNEHSVESTESNKPVVKRLMCLFCDRTFATNNLKQKHVDRCHSSGQTRRSSSRTATHNQSTTACCFCNKFNNTDHTLKELLEHLTDEHSNRYFACLACQERFNSVQILRDHNRSIHNLQDPIEIKASSAPASSSETNGEIITELSAATSALEIVQPELIRTNSDNILQETLKENTSSPKSSTTKLIDKDSSSKIVTDPETNIQETKTEDTTGFKDDFEDAIHVNVISQEVAIQSKPPEIDEEDIVLSKRVKSSAMNTKTKNKRSQIVNKKISVKSTKNGLRNNIRMTRASVKQMNSFNKIRKNKLVTNNESESNNKISKKYGVNSASVFSLVNAYIYKYEKIYDHASDSIKDGNSVQFNAVFDREFYTRTVRNIRDNLLHHLDGKLNRNIESENRISNFEHVAETEGKSANDAVDNFGCDLSLNAATPVATLLNSSQYGEDFDAQIEYGAKASQKNAKKVAVVKYKFTNKKYNSLFRKNDSQSDLTCLDMWTQLSVKRRQQKYNTDHFIEELLNYQRPTGESKFQVKELNRILDTRGPFEDLRLEANAAQFLELRKKSAKEGDNISEEASNDVYFVLEDLLNRVISKASEKTEEDIELKKEIQLPEDQLVLSNYLQLQRCSSNSDIRMDKTDSIAMICASQDENEMKQKKYLELSGEWARPRIYICATCGQKMPNYKSLEDHKNMTHPHIWCSHYEFVGNQSRIYRNLSIPGVGKVGNVELLPLNRQWQRSDARVCSKCAKHCHNLGELHKHILECGGDWTWMLARKKCKYRPYGARTRRRRQRGYKRSCNPEVTRAREHKPKIKPIFIGPRPKPSKPSDAETIERMLANLPPKRNRKMISMRDGIQRPRNSYKQQLINQNSSSKSNKKVLFKSNSSQIVKQTLRNALKRKITANNLRKQNKNDSDSDTPILLRTRFKKDENKIDTTDIVNEYDITKQLMNKRTKLRSTRMISRILGSKIFDNNSTIATRRKIAKAIAQNNLIRKTRLRSKIKTQQLSSTQEEDEINDDAPVKNKTPFENEKKTKVDVKNQNPNDDNDPNLIEEDDTISQIIESVVKASKESNTKRILSVLTKTNKKAKIQATDNSKPDTINSIIDEVISKAIRNELFVDKLGEDKTTDKGIRCTRSSSSLLKTDPNLNNCLKNAENMGNKNDNSSEEIKVQQIDIKPTKKSSKLLQNVKSFRKSLKKSVKRETGEKGKSIKSKFMRKLKMRGSKRKKYIKNKAQSETSSTKAKTDDQNDLKKTAADVSNLLNEPETDNKNDSETSLKQCDMKKSECELNCDPIVMPILEKIEPLPLNLSSDTSIESVPILCPVNAVTCENQQETKSDIKSYGESASEIVLSECDKSNTINCNNAVNKIKNKLKRSGRGLNDCIAMLKCKLEQKYSNNEPSLVDKSNLFILNSSEVNKHSQPVVQENLITPSCSTGKTKSNQDILVNNKLEEESTSKIKNNSKENKLTENANNEAKNELDGTKVKNRNVLEIPSVKFHPKNDISSSEMTTVETQTQTADDDIAPNASIDYIPTNIQTNLQLSYVLNATLQNCLMECVKNKCETFKIENQNTKSNKNKIGTKIDSNKKFPVLKIGSTVKETKKVKPNTPVLLNTAVIENTCKKSKNKSKSNASKVSLKAASDTSDDDIPLSKLVSHFSSGTKFKVKLPVDKKKRSSKKQIAFTPLILNNQDSCIPQISLQERIERQISLENSIPTEVTTLKEIIDDVEENYSNLEITDENNKTQPKTENTDTLNDQVAFSVNDSATLNVIKETEVDESIPVDLSTKNDTFIAEEQKVSSQFLSESNELKGKTVEETSTEINIEDQELIESSEEMLQENVANINTCSKSEEIISEAVQEPFTTEEMTDSLHPLSQPLIAVEDELCDNFPVSKTLTEANIKPHTPTRTYSSENIELINKITHLDSGKENTECQIIKKQKRIIRKQKTKRKRNENKTANIKTEIYESVIENDFAADLDQSNKSENNSASNQKKIDKAKSRKNLNESQPDELEISYDTSDDVKHDQTVEKPERNVLEVATKDILEIINQKPGTKTDSNNSTNDYSDDLILKSKTDPSKNNDSVAKDKLENETGIIQEKSRRRRNFSRLTNLETGKNNLNTDIANITSLDELAGEKNISKQKSRRKRNTATSINTERKTETPNTDGSSSTSFEELTENEEMSKRKCRRKRSTTVPIDTKTEEIYPNINISDNTSLEELAENKEVSKQIRKRSTAIPNYPKTEIDNSSTDGSGIVILKRLIENEKIGKQKSRRKRSTVILNYSESEINNPNTDGFGTTSLEEIVESGEADKEKSNTETKTSNTNIYSYLEKNVEYEEVSKQNTRQKRSTTMENYSKFEIDNPSTGTTSLEEIAENGKMNKQNSRRKRSTAIPDYLEYKINNPNTDESATTTLEEIADYEEDNRQDFKTKQSAAIEDYCETAIDNSNIDQSSISNLKKLTKNEEIGKQRSRRKRSIAIPNYSESEIENPNTDGSDKTSLKEIVNNKKIGKQNTRRKQNITIPIYSETENNDSNTGGSSTTSFEEIEKNKKVGKQKTRRERGTTISNYSEMHISTSIDGSGDISLEEIEENGEISKQNVRKKRSSTISDPSETVINNSSTALSEATNSAGAAENGVSKEKSGRKRSTVGIMYSVAEIEDHSIKQSNIATSNISIDDIVLCELEPKMQESSKQQNISESSSIALESSNLSVENSENQNDLSSVSSDLDKVEEEFNVDVLTKDGALNIMKVIERKSEKTDKEISNSGIDISDSLTSDLSKEISEISVSNPTIETESSNEEEFSKKRNGKKHSVTKRSSFAEEVNNSSTNISGGFDQNELEEKSEIDISNESSSSYESKSSKQKTLNDRNVSKSINIEEKIEKSNISESIDLIEELKVELSEILAPETKSNNRKVRRTRNIKTEIINQNNDTLVTTNLDQQAEKSENDSYNSPDNKIISSKRMYRRKRSINKTIDHDTEIDKTINEVALGINLDQSIEVSTDNSNINKKLSDQSGTDGITLHLCLNKKIKPKKKRGKKRNTESIPDTSSSINLNPSTKESKDDCNISSEDKPLNSVEETTNNLKFKLSNNEAEKSKKKRGRSKSANLATDLNKSVNAELDSSIENLENIIFETEISIDNENSCIQTEIIKEKSRKRRKNRIRHESEKEDESYTDICDYTNINQRPYNSEHDIYNISTRDESVTNLKLKLCLNKEVDQSLRNRKGKIINNEINDFITDQNQSEHIDDPANIEVACEKNSAETEICDYDKNLDKLIENVVSNTSSVDNQIAPKKIVPEIRRKRRGRPKKIRNKSETNKVRLSNVNKSIDESSQCSKNKIVSDDNVVHTIAELINEKLDNIVLNSTAASPISKEIDSPEVVTSEKISNIKLKMSLNNEKESLEEKPKRKDQNQIDFETRINESDIVIPSTNENQTLGASTSIPHLLDTVPLEAIQKFKNNVGIKIVASDEIEIYDPITITTSNLDHLNENSTKFIVDIPKIIQNYEIVSDISATNSDLDQKRETVNKIMRRRTKNKPNYSEMLQADVADPDNFDNSDVDQTQEIRKKSKRKQNKKPLKTPVEINNFDTDISGTTEQITHSSQTLRKDSNNYDLPVENETEPKEKQSKVKRGRKKMVNKTEISKAIIDPIITEMKENNDTVIEVIESVIKQSAEMIDNRNYSITIENQPIVLVENVDHYNFNDSIEDDVKPIEKSKRKRKSRINNYQEIKSVTDISPTADLFHITSKHSNDDYFEDMSEIIANELSDTSEITRKSALEETEQKSKERGSREKIVESQGEQTEPSTDISRKEQSEYSRSGIDNLCNTSFEKIPENLTDENLTNIFKSNLQLCVENEPDCTLIEDKNIEITPKISFQIKPLSNRQNIVSSDSEDELPLSILVKNKPQEAELPVIEENLDIEFDNDIEKEIVQSLEINKIIEDVISNNDEESALNIENIDNNNFIDINEADIINADLSKLNNSLEEHISVSVENNVEDTKNQREINISMSEIKSESFCRDYENKSTKKIFDIIETNKKDNQNENLQTHFDGSNLKTDNQHSENLFVENICDENSENQEIENTSQQMVHLDDNLSEKLETTSDKCLENKSSFVATPDLADTSLRIRIKRNLKIKIRKSKKTRKRVIPKSLSRYNIKRKELNGASFFCDICRKLFKRKENLASHKKTLTHIAKLSAIEAWQENMIKKYEYFEENDEISGTEDFENQFEDYKVTIEENDFSDNQEQDEIYRITEKLKQEAIKNIENTLNCTDPADTKNNGNILEETLDEQYNIAAEIVDEENNLNIIKENMWIEEKSLENYGKEMIKMNEEFVENQNLLNNPKPEISVRPMEEILAPRKPKTNLMPSLLVTNSTTNLKLVDIISEVLDKPVNNLDIGEMDYLPESISKSSHCDSNDKYSEPKKYKSLGERKSFDADNFNSQNKLNHEITVEENLNSTIESVNNGLLNKQLSLLENIIEETNPNLHYIDDSVSLPSNQFEEPVRQISEKTVFKPEYSKSNPQIEFSHSSNVLSSFIKPNSHFNHFGNLSATFAKPTKHHSEENTKTYDDEEQNKSKENSKRKILNRDEELFLECCSLLKSGSEIPGVSKKSTRNIPLHNFSRSNDASWIIQKPPNSEQFIQRDSYSWLAQSSRVDTPIGEPFVNNDWSNSNSAVSSEWLAQKAPSPDRPIESSTLMKKTNNNSGETTYSDIQFEDISIDTSLETSKTLMAVDNCSTENIPLDFHHLDFSGKNSITESESQLEDPLGSNKLEEHILEELIENKVKPEFHKIQEQQEDIEESELKIDEDEPNKEFDSDLKKRVVSAFGGLMAKALSNRLHAVVRRSKKTKGKRDFASTIQASITDYAVPAKKNKLTTMDSDSCECPKKLITKGAMKVFEGLKVSIPTQDLNLTDVLNCSSKPINGEAVELETETINQQTEPREDSAVEETAEKIVEETNKNSKLKNLFGRFGNKLGLRETKKKAAKHRNRSKNIGNKKNHDVYEFEESVDNNFIYKAEKFSLFRSKEQNFEKALNVETIGENKKIGDTKLNHESGINSLKWNRNESESDTDRYYDSMSFEEISFSSESTHGSDLIMHKAKQIQKKHVEKSKENQKKCMIMGRIFKNASKPKLEDKIPEIRDISSEENSKLVGNYLDSCSSVDNVENTSKQEVPTVPNNVTVVNNCANKMSKAEMDSLFDKLLQEEKKHTERNLSLQLSALGTEKLNKEIINKMLPPSVDKSILEKRKLKEGKPKTSGKIKKRQRHNSGDSTSSDEFTLTGKHPKSSKKQHKAPRKSTKTKKDTGINLEQEMKECIGVAGRKSQRKCTSGKQNVLVEVWSSDESSFEEVIKMLAKENESANIIEENEETEKNEEAPIIEEILVNSNISNQGIPSAEMIEAPKNSIDIYDFESDAETKQDHLKIKIKLNDQTLKQDTEFLATNKIKIPKKTRRISKNRKHNKSHGEESEDTEYEAEKARKREHKRKKIVEGSEIAGPDINPDCLAVTRKKRNAGDQLYYWSSSSEDEFQDLIEVKPIREDTEDDRPMQHGWIVGDSPKKLVTMLAQAKGKKVEGESVKEQGKKNRVTL